MSREDAGKEDAGKEDADRAPLHTPEEWAAIARQAGQRAKQDQDARRGTFRGDPRIVIPVLLGCIAFALAALLAPEAHHDAFIRPQMDFERPQVTWLNAHPAARFLYTVFVAAVIAAGVWRRVKHSQRATQQEIEQLRVK